MFVMNQHQSNNTKKTYMASWFNGKISINCPDVNVVHYRQLFVAMLNFPPNIYHITSSYFRVMAVRQIITFKYRLCLIYWHLDVSDLIDMVIIHKYKRLNST
jgi:hypothetical protein